MCRKSAERTGERESESEIKRGRESEHKQAIERHREREGKERERGEKHNTQALWWD